MKFNLAQTLFRFEGIELSQIQTRQLLNEEKLQELNFLNPIRGKTFIANSPDL